MSQHLHFKTATVRALALDYLHYQQGLLKAKSRDALAASTLKSYRASLEGQIIPEFGAMLCKAFTPGHAARFLFEARAKNRSVAANRDFAALMSMFNHAMSIGVLGSNPCRGVRRNREHPRKRAVEIVEFNQLMALAAEQHRPLRMAALIGAAVALSGRRRGELLDLTLEAVASDGLMVPEKKTAKFGERTYRVSWRPLLRRVIEEAATLSGSAAGTAAPIFANLNGEPYTDSGFKTNWSRLMRLYEHRHGARFRAHDLRSLYVSETLKKGGKPETHLNETTMRRVYDRRTVVDVEALA
jgi:integrase